MVEQVSKIFVNCIWFDLSVIKCIFKYKSTSILRFKENIYFEHKQWCQLFLISHTEGDCSF